MKIDLIAGARPNFIKIASIVSAIEKVQTKQKTITFRLIHTGQHYDEKMSGSFFKQLDIPFPDFNLGAGGGTQAEQTAAIMIGYERILFENKPDFCLVVGDVNSTLACAITAQKMHVKVVHIEAGIRSGDWLMPEEINRLVTDSISNYFFTTTKNASKLLIQTNVSKEKIFFVGNTMIDTLLKYRSKFTKPIFWDKFGLFSKGYIVVTLHRPNNVDSHNNLKNIINEIIDQTGNLPIIFPAHPRTEKILNQIGIKNPKLHLVEPLGYLEFNYLVENSMAVITDSGGVTEETTIMRVPCMTLRDNTERPETINIGTNELLGTDPKVIGLAMKKLFSGNWKKGGIPELWDGKTGERIVKILLDIYERD
jgi:UDP-N-acetylglucosamine 2-epimerase (non-hydrolysing)